jgi:hypothetical protein
MSGQTTFEDRRAPVHQPITTLGTYMASNLRALRYPCGHRIQWEKHSLVALGVSYRTAQTHEIRDGTKTPDQAPSIMSTATPMLVITVAGGHFVFQVPEQMSNTANSS